MTEVIKTILDTLPIDSVHTVGKGVRDWEINKGDKMAVRSVKVDEHGIAVVLEVLTGKMAGNRRTYLPSGGNMSGIRKRRFHRDDPTKVLVLEL